MLLLSIITVVGVATAAAPPRSMDPLVSEITTPATASRQPASSRFPEASNITGDIIVLSNGLVERVFSMQPAFATVGLDTGPA